MAGLACANQKGAKVRVPQQSSQPWVCITAFRSALRVDVKQGVLLLFLTKIVPFFHIHPAQIRSFQFCGLSFYFLRKKCFLKPCLSPHPKSLEEAQNHPDCLRSVRIHFLVQRAWVCHVCLRVVMIHFRVRGARGLQVCLGVVRIHFLVLRQADFLW